MVENTFSKYPSSIKALKKIDAIKFFAVVKMDDLTDRWSLLFGLVDAEDLDKRKLLFEKIRSIILKHLSKEDMQEVARIGLFPISDHLINDLAQFPENGTINSVKANGNFIHEGYVLISPKRRASSGKKSNPTNH